MEGSIDFDLDYYEMIYEKDIDSTKKNIALFEKTKKNYYKSEIQRLLNKTDSFPKILMDRQIKKLTKDLDKALEDFKIRFDSLYKKKKE